MSNKNKKVTYKHPIDENVDYLVPLQYDTHSSKIRQSKSLSSSSSSTNILFGSIHLPISLLCYLGIPISQLIIGLIYIGQCPVQDLIVIWMIVSGIFGILFVIIGIIIHIQIRKQSYSSITRILIPIFIIILLFIIAWFFAGQVFIFEVKLRVEFFDPTLPDYCHGNLYKSAYILIFIEYLIFLLVIILNILSYITPPEDNHQEKRPKT